MNDVKHGRRKICSKHLGNDCMPQKKMEEAHSAAEAMKRENAAALLSRTVFRTVTARVHNMLHMPRVIRVKRAWRAVVTARPCSRSTN